jgi:hypothetical protein
MTLHLVTVNGWRVGSATVASYPRPYARLADCGGNLFAAYQNAKAAWDTARVTDDPNRERLRWCAINAYDAWALSCGMASIQAPGVWGFN